MPSSIPNKTAESRVGTSRDTLLDRLVRPFVKIPSDEQFNADPAISKPRDVLEKLRAEIGEGPVFAAVEKRYHDVLDSVSQYAKNMDVPHLDFRLTTGSHSSHSSPNGKNYIIFNNVEFELLLQSDLGTEVAKSLGGHEVAHIHNKDTLPWRSGLALKSETEQKKAEIATDIIGTGPLGSHDPDALANYFKISLMAFAQAQHKRADLSDADLRQTNRDHAEAHDRRHPTLIERISYLERSAVLMKEYEATHKVVMPEDRARESEWLVATIQKEVAEGRIPETNDLTIRIRETPPATSLSEDQKQQIQAMQSLPMKTMDSSTAPLAPALQETVRER